MPPPSPPAGWPRSRRTDTLNKASAAATAYFDQAKPSGVVTSTLQFSPDAAQHRSSR